MKIPAFITVRSSSTRLPEKCFLPFGNGTVLEHMIQRVQHYDLEPIVCTTTSESDDAIVDLAKKCNVKFYRGPIANKLLRWSQCCEHFSLDSFHSVDADDPFFCGDEVKRSYELLQTGFDMVAPSPSSSNGGATVGYSLTADIVKRASLGMSDDLDTEMMWSYIERVSGLKKIVLKDPSNFMVKNRMTLDYHEDYVLLEAIRLMIGNLATREQVFNIIKKNLNLVKINEFRSSEWKQGQNNKLFKQKD
jgi:spore coat polysaccharide biosynthesis protein SpsF